MWLEAWRCSSWVIRLSGAAALACLVGCRAAPEGPITVEFWAMGREGEVVQQLVPEFERQHAGIRVRVQQIPWSAAHEKLLTAYVGGTMPDVFQVGNTWIPEFVALNAIAPLDVRLQHSTAIAPADYFQGILDTNIIAGYTYGVPWYVDTRVLFYRSDILRDAGVLQPPTTWQDWLDAMVAIKARVGADRYAILLPLTEWQTPVILALQRGAALLRDHDQYGDFQSAAFRDAFDFYVDLFRRGLAPHSGAAQAANVYQDFAAGYFALYITGPWNIGEFQHRLPRSLDDKWSTAPLPSATAEYPGVSVAGGSSLALGRAAPHAEAAWQWIEFLSAPEQQLEFYRLTGDLPPRRSAWAAGGLERDAYVGAFWAQLQRVQSTPKIPEWERIADAISRYAEAAIRGELSSAAALAALDSDVDAMLEKRRWMMRAQVASQ